MAEKNSKIGIISLLKKHPEGLTIADISKLTGLNRLTVGKYIYGMVIDGSVKQRKVGPAKICYLKKKS